jgi:preprotein translocase subunit YajC
MLSLFSVANAQSMPAAGAGGSFDPMSLLPFVFIIVIFYFLIFRPQQKRMKQQREMLASLRRGDKVLTSGGILGTIDRVEEKELHVEISSGVVVRLNRGSVTEVFSKPGTVTAPVTTSSSAASKPAMKIVPKAAVAKKPVAKKPAAKSAPKKK